MASTEKTAGRGVHFWALPDSGLAKAGLNKLGKLEIAWPSLVALPDEVMTALPKSSDQFWFPPLNGAHLASPAWVLNVCADAQIYSRGLDWLDKTWVGKVPVFNAPEATRQAARDRKVEMFGAIEGLTVPATRRVSFSTEADLLAAFEKSGMQYPVLLRPTRGQNGLGLIRIDGPSGWANAIGTETMHEEHFLIQFEDYRTAEGEFLKARVLFVDGVPFVRHVKAAAEWMVHNTAPASVPGFAKDREMGVIDALEADADFMRICRDIGAALPLDFFGADIGVDLANRRFVLFEANASMAVFFPLRDTLTEGQLARRVRLQDTPAKALAELIADPSRWRSQPAR